MFNGLHRIATGALLGLALLGSVNPATAGNSSAGLRAPAAQEINRHCTDPGVFSTRYFACQMLSGS